MDIFSSFLFKRTMLQFLECKDLASHKGKALTDKIRLSASQNLMSILESITGTDSAHSDLLKSICLENIDNASYEFFLDNLSHDQTIFRAVAGDILVQSKTVKAEELFKRLHEPGTNRSEIIRILHTQKHHLRPEDIINNALESDATKSLEILDLLKDSIWPVNLSEIRIQPANIDEPSVSIALLEYLASVQQPEVARFIIPFLADKNKEVVCQALKSLSNLTMRFDVAPLLPFINNLSTSEQALVLDIITNQISHILIPRLSICFAGEPSAIQTGLAKLIAEHANKHSFESFLVHLEKETQSTKEHAIQLFLKLHNKNLFDATRDLSDHESDFVSNSAQRITGCQLSSDYLQRLGDEYLEKLGEFALTDDRQVQTRAIKSLGKSSNRASLAILKKVLKKYPDTAIEILEAVRDLGFSKGLEITLACLDQDNPVVQRAALETIDCIVAEKHIDNIRDSITWKMPGFSPEISAFAHLVLKKLDPESTDVEDDEDRTERVSSEFNFRAQRSTDPDIENIEIGSTWLGRFNILKEIGKGRMGVVMLAEDLETNQSTVLKVMLPELTKDLDSRERFRREFTYTRKVSHPCVIQVHNLFLTKNICAISMDFFESKGLNVIINELKIFDSRLGLELLLQLSSGFAAAHDQGVIHRDIKPSNILVNSAGEIRIVDFGIATLENGLDVSLTMNNAIIGSPAYLAPERVEGLNAGSPSDIYSLGVIAYYMFSGELPYKGKPMDILMQHREGNVTMVHKVNKNANQDISLWVNQLMALKPENRPPSMSAVHDQIKVLLTTL